MSEMIVVGISDMKLARKPNSLVTYALGSCVGICLWDPLVGLGGLAHILLPDSSLCPADNNRMKFADTAIPDLVGRHVEQGAMRYRITAKIAGGARLFGSSSVVNIGDRNVLAVRQELSRLNIRLVAEDTGLDYGRTIFFSPASGMLQIRSVKRPEKTM